MLWHPRTPFFRLTSDYGSYSRVSDGTSWIILHPHRHLLGPGADIREEAGKNECAEAARAQERERFVEGAH
jgi:hypothetical protein